MNLITRQTWGATAKTIGQMTLPSRGCWLHHSVTRRTANPYGDQRAIEQIGVERFGRYSYSWAYHLGPRAWLEGAGNTVGAHTKGQNSSTHGLVLIGNFDVEPLPDYAIADIADFIRYGGRQGWWEPRLLGGHRDVAGASTACPGRHAHAAIPDIRSAIANRPAPIEEDHMRRGDSGNEVVMLQRRLADELGREVAADGQFGPATEQAVKDVQTKFGYAQSGVYDLALSDRISELRTARRVARAVERVAGASGVDEDTVRRLVDEQLADLTIVRGTS